MEILSIIGAFIAIEGALYAGAPSLIRSFAAQVVEMDDATLRKLGFVALVLGVGLVWLARG